MNDDNIGGRRLVTNRRLVWLVGLAILLVLLIFFIAENFVLVEIRLIVTRVQVRLVWALVTAFLIGGVTGVLLASMRRGRL
jgi:uncharacterized integral membrane protein